MLVSQDGRQWQSVARRDRTAANRARRLPYLPVDRLPEKSWDGFLQYAFLRERATWSNIPADDHLSPLLVDRPAVPGGAPYWGRIARLAPLERVLVLFEEMIERLDRQGLDVAAERAQAADLRRQAAEDPDSEALYLAARRAKRQLFFRDPGPGTAGAHPVRQAASVPGIAQLQRASGRDSRAGWRRLCAAHSPRRAGPIPAGPRPHPAALRRQRGHRARAGVGLRRQDHLFRLPARQAVGRRLGFVLAPVCDGSRRLRPAEADRRTVSRFRRGRACPTAAWPSTARAAKSASSAGGRRPTCCTAWKPTARTCGAFPTPT